MDKSWINAPRISDVYKNGCESFIQFASHAEALETIPCPCLKCCNDKRLSTEKVLRHILFNGFCPGYTTWTLHGEQVSSEYDTSYIRKLVSKTTIVPRDTLSQTDTLRDMLHAALGINLGEDLNSEISESNEGQTSENDEGLQLIFKEGNEENIVRKYYGFIRDIYNLDFYGKGNVVIFRCDWVNINSSRGLKKDKYGLPLVSFTRLIYTSEALKDDPFVLSTNAKQVFYVQNGKDSEWMYVVETKPRDLYDMSSHLEDGDDDSYTNACL